MKFAIVNSNTSRINRIVDVEPEFLPENVTAISITNAKATAYESMEQPVFLVDGELTTRAEMREIRIRQRNQERFIADPEGYKDELIEKARYERQQVEEGGFSFGGMTIPSDRTSQAMINGAFSAAKEDETFTTKWQVTPATFVDLDAATIIGMGHVLRDHVKGAFTAQADKVEAILAATTFEELEEI